MLNFGSSSLLFIFKFRGKTKHLKTHEKMEQVRRLKETLRQEHIFEHLLENIVQIVMV